MKKAEIFCNDLGFNSPDFLCETIDNIQYRIVYFNNIESVNPQYIINGLTTDAGTQLNVITITYYLNMSESDISSSDFLSYLEVVCFHEYFHTIINKYGINQLLDVPHEGIATFMEMYYIVNQDIVNNQYVKEMLTERVWNNQFIESPSKLTLVDDCDENLKYGYGIALFNLFLYEKFGNIEFIKTFLNTESFDPLSRYIKVAEAYNVSFSQLYEEFSIFRVNPNKYINFLPDYYISDWELNRELRSDLNLIYTYDYASTNVCTEHYSNIYAPKYIYGYSWHCIRIEKKDLSVDKIIELNFQLNSNITDDVKIYIIEEYDNYFHEYVYFEPSKNNEYSEIKFSKNKPETNEYLEL